MKSTIYDVANETGYSIATISRVINKNGKVRAETEKKILAAIEKLHYEPSLAAKGLAASKTGIVSLMLNRILSTKNESQYSIRFIYGFLSEMSLNDYEVLIKNVDLDTISKQHFDADSLQTDGAVFMVVPDNERKIKALIDNSKSVVYAGVQQSFDTVGYNIYGGYHLYRRDLLDLVFERGYRNALMIDPLGATESEMYDITQKTINETVKKYEPFGFNYQIIDSYEIGESLENLLVTDNPPDVLVFHGMECYVEASEVFNRRGISIPKDIGVVGVSHSRSAGTEFTPEVSTIYLDAFEMGRRAGELLLKLIREEDIKGFEHNVPYTFIDRGSIPKK